ncbi:hypothetical protein F5883DRAFT_360151, partial [Diaporthe sp. PMI_573]
GKRAGHNVVLATCPSAMAGSVILSNIYEPMNRTFPNIKTTLLVGTGSGIPQASSFSNPDSDVRLGDVVLGWPISTEG